MPNVRKDSVVDNYHGTTVPDPYRWLEDPSSSDTKDWVEEQNKVSRAFLDSFPEREKIRQRLTELWNYPKYSVPKSEGERYFFQKNDGLQNQAVLYVQDSLLAEPRVILDPNLLSEDGTVALTGYFPSLDGKLVAYSTSASGSDWQQIHVREVDGGQDRNDVIRHCKFTNVSWSPDNSGFFYTRFPDPSTVSPEEQSYNSKVYYHQLGSPQDEDQLIYERPDFRELGFHSQITEDNTYIILTVWHGTDSENRVYYRELGSEEPFVKLLDDADASYQFVTNVGSVFYFQTTLNTPRGSVIAIDISQPQRSNWRIVVPEQSDVLDFMVAAGNCLAAIYLHHAQHKITLYTLNGDYIRDIPLPGIGSVVGINGKLQQTEMFLTFTSFLYPATVFRYDFTTDQLSPMWKVKLSFEPSHYETRQVFYTSQDGTRIPLFLNYRKGASQRGDNPTILYGYGGFNVSLTPAFSPTQIAWMDLGGVYAVACLRGGSEYGEEWHRAGMLENKQNVFDDFHAAAQWLVRENYTSVEKLSIMGGSNGGLLVAACMLQWPQAFGAVVCRVPVADMLRYHKFTVGRYWTGEYGNAETNPEHFKFLYAYSPLHNVRSGVDYPPTLIMTADTDDRVVPAHAMKFAATLQEHYKGPSPIITRVEMKAGHGAGKPTSKLIDETVDIYSFLLKVFSA